MANLSSRILETEQGSSELVHTSPRPVGTGIGNQGPVARGTRVQDKKQDYKSSAMRNCQRQMSAKADLEEGTLPFYSLYHLYTVMWQTASWKVVRVQDPHVSQPIFPWVEGNKERAWLSHAPML